MTDKPIPTSVPYVIYGDQPLSGPLDFSPAKVERIYLDGQLVWTAENGLLVAADELHGITEIAGVALASVA